MWITFIFKINKYSNIRKSIVGVQQKVFIEESMLKEANLCPPRKQLAGPPHEQLDGPSVQQPSTSSGNSSSNEKNEWSAGDTKFVLDRYEMYLPEIGPMKRFRTKKHMWRQIADDMAKSGVFRTAIQVENRYKTVLRRKHSVDKKRRRTGESPEPFEYDDELKKIAAIDDSVQPEVRASAGQVEVAVEVSDEEPRPSIKKKRKKASSSSEIIRALKEIAADKEATRERRHKEKMELLKELLK